MWSQAHADKLNVGMYLVYVNKLCKIYECTILVLPVINFSYLVPYIFEYAHA